MYKLNRDMTDIKEINISRKIYYVTNQIQELKIVAFHI